jgi:hypothetical protein
MSKSECVKTQWTDVKAAVKVYTSLERDVALHLCGWKLDKENPLESVLEKLEVREELAMQNVPGSIPKVDSKFRGRTWRTQWAPKRK